MYIQYLQRHNLYIFKRKVSEVKHKLQSILAATLLSVSLYSQPKPLTVGDTVPAHLLTSLTANLPSLFPSPSGEGGRRPDEVGPGVKPSPFRGITGGIILDFFTTWCTACVKAIPHLDSLQKQFGNKLRVFVVTYEQQDKIEAFRKKNKVFAASSLPVITNDTILHKLFPHLLIPHEVWIDANGIVRAITSDEYITANNISDFIAGKPLHLPLKKDNTEYDYHKPLFENDNGAAAVIRLYRSSWAAELPGFSARRAVVKEENTIRYCFINHQAINLYKAALKLPSNRFIISSAFLDGHLFTSNENSTGNEFFTYELTVPSATSPSKLQSLMVSDLNSYLGVSGSLQWVWVDAFAVRKFKTVTATSGDSISSVHFIDSLNSWQFIHQPVSAIVQALNSDISSRPPNPVILDETGMKEYLDISLPGPAMYDMSLLKKALQPYGLTIIQVKRKMKMFVIKDNNE